MRSVRFLAGTWWQNHENNQMMYTKKKTGEVAFGYDSGSDYSMWTTCTLKSEQFVIKSHDPTIQRNLEFHASL